MTRQQVVTRAALAVCASTLIGAAALQGRQPSGEPVRCDTVLTSAEATAAAGDGYEGPAVNAFRPGHTECVWQGNDTTISFSFRTLADLKADSDTPEAAFDMDVLAVESETRKRELLKDIGTRAAIVGLEGNAFRIARMITYKVSRETTIALGRAIATP